MKYYTFQVLFLLSLKKDPEFAPDKLRRNAIFCFHTETKKALILW